MNDKTLHIIRGISGSGKSTFCRERLGLDPIEADQYFEGLSEGYAFNPQFLKDAHLWCKMEVKRHLAQSVKKVAVVNTFSMMWEIEPYLELAKEFNYNIIIYRMTGEYQNTHGVPPEVIQRMKDRFEDIEGESIL
jgi:predicted kinase